MSAYSELMHVPHTSRPILAHSSLTVVSLVSHEIPLWPDTHFIFSHIDQLSEVHFVSEFSGFSFPSNKWYCPVSGCFFNVYVFLDMITHFVDFIDFKTSLPVDNNAMNRNHPHPLMPWKARKAALRTHIIGSNKYKKMFINHSCFIFN